MPGRSVSVSDVSTPADLPKVAVSRSLKVSDPTTPAESLSLNVGIPIAPHPSDSITLSEKVSLRFHPKLTKVVIVYSPNLYRRRTVIIPDEDAQVPIHTANLAPGEAVFVTELSQYVLIGPDKILEHYTGRKPKSDRCMVVRGNKVQMAIHADPQIDVHPEGSLTIDTSGRATKGHKVANGRAIL